MDGSKESDRGEAAPKVWGSEEEKLDRALVTGLLLEVILETAGSPVDSQARRHLVKTRLKDTLVTHLAGRVTLDRFHHLLRKLDHWFPIYYPLITAVRPAKPGPEARTAAPRPQGQGALRRERLQAWLNEKGPDLLPRRPHRKLNLEKLREFLINTQGGWFRLKDFQQCFGVERKTAWEYLFKFRQAGLLRHNYGRSSAVRYALETCFLAVRSEALGARVREALSGLHPDLADQVSEALVTSGGEAFREDDWKTLGNAHLRQKAINLLVAAGILEEASRAGEPRRLRLARRWRRDQDGRP